MNSTRWFGLGALALAAGCAQATSTGGSPVPPSPAIERGFSETDCALLAAYRSALEQPSVREASRTEILRQLRRIPPVARVADHWVTPIDLGGVLVLPEVEGAVRARLTVAGVEAAATLRLGPGGTGERRDLLAVAFAAERWRRDLTLPYVGELRGPATTWDVPAVVLIVPLRDVENGLVEYLPPPPPADEEPCHYFCGDPESWDFDADGTANHADPDDDGDGARDEDDDYPYWPQGSDCACEEDYTGVTGKFSAQVTAAVLHASRTAVRNADKTRVSLGPFAQNRGTVTFAFPDAGGCPRPEQACPDPTDPGVHYVSRDPYDCARLRFRCESGQVPFSNDCGCGCAPEGSPR